MIEIKNVITPSPEQWKALILGARNAMNSWERSDSGWEPQFDTAQGPVAGEFVIGPNDHDLMMTLRNAGTDHRKFMRMITVYLDVTAPLYWWKEFSTYKVGTVANSCSTMHKIHAKEFEESDFSVEHLFDAESEGIEFPIIYGKEHSPIWSLHVTIRMLNFYREKYLETNDKKYWWQMIQLLPTSYNQKRTVMLNYEVLANIYKSRKGHKLDEWHTFCDWIESLPYSELITGKSIEEKGQQ